MKKTGNRSGFTLIELLAVIGIIAILAGLVLGISGIATRKAAESQARAQIEHIKDALEEYRIAKGTLLRNISDPPHAMTNAVFEVLTNYVADIDFVDPWGQSIQYERSGKYTFAVRSSGPDGKINATKSHPDNVDNITNESEN